MARKSIRIAIDKKKLEKILIASIFLAFFNIGGPILFSVIFVSVNCITDSINSNKDRNSILEISKKNVYSIKRTCIVAIVLNVIAIALHLLLLSSQAEPRYYDLSYPYIILSIIGFVFSIWIISISKRIINDIESNREYTYDLKDKKDATSSSVKIQSDAIDDGLTNDEYTDDI